MNDFAYRPLKKAVNTWFDGKKIFKLIWVRILDQEKGLKNVTEARYCQFLLSHSINTSLKNSVP